MKVIRFFSVSILTILFSSYSVAQLDSVWYQGPSVGSVTSGAIQTTDIFTDDIPLFGVELKINPPINGSEDEIGDMLHNWDESLLPEYVYVEDSNVPADQKGNGSHTVLLNSFEGIAMTNFIPPDPAIAVGPDHIIICVNSMFRIYDKKGNIIKTIPAGGWWGPAWPDENGDPQVIYDHYAGRWVLVWMQVNDAAQTAGNLIAYSDDENPLGDWYMYRLDTKMHGIVPSNTWGDYPHVGFDEEGIYILTRCIDFGGSGLLYNKIRIINKNELYSSNAGPLTYNDIWDIRKPGEGAAGQMLDCIHPGISYTPGNGEWFYWARGIYGGNPVSADFYAIYKITNPLTSPVLEGKVLPVQPYTSPPLANQLGGGMGLETIGWITARPVVRDGYLYTSHDIQNSTNANYSSIKYLKIDLSTVSIIENVEFGSIGYFYLFPALTIDQDKNIAVTFSRSGDTEYVGSYYSTWHANDPAGFSPSQPVAEGQGNYVVTYSGSINRWGDYFGIYLDPDNFYDVWTFSEYAAATNVWGTYVGQIRMVPFPGPTVFTNPDFIDFGDLEVGTTSDISTIQFANYGDQDLVITDIPLSVGDFNLETSLSFPLTLSSYDSLEVEFSFSPTLAGETTIEYTISSNDTSFSGLTLAGNGYKMYPALDKTIYASTGGQNNGDIIKINKISGAGAIVGPSLFTEIKDITIHPSTGIMYGLVARSGDADIVRVSAAGDAYLLFTISIPTMAGIAFNTTGTLYGITSGGEIYTIDLINGTITFVVTGQGSYSGITYNPVTNELWASSRSFVPPNKDAIFTVDLATGDTTIIGHTGLNIQTNDIVFDENENLYGVIGASSELNDFVSIDISNGVGTVIGSVGMKNVLGLAFEETGVTSVEDDVNKTVPTEFSLEQNYPNPFNPSTRIRYSVPQNSNVELKVFDILGRKVITLVNEIKSVGTYEIYYNAVGLPSGIYFYQLRAGDYVEIKKMLLLK